MSRFDELLCLVLGELEEERVNRIMADTEADFEPSLCYKRRMNRLIRRTDQGPWIHRPVGKCFVAAMIAFCILCTTVFGVKATRVAIVEFFTRIVGEWMHICFEEEDIQKAPKTLEIAYVPQYIPTGYEEESYARRHLSVNIVWRNSDGQIIVWRQGTLGEMTAVRSDGAVETQIRNIPVVYYKSEGYHSWHWYANEYQFLLVTYEDFPIEEIEKIIDSVVAEE